MDGGISEEELVMSDIHLGCPPGFSGPHISQFTISLPSDNESSRFVGDVLSSNRVVSFDEDGDLVLRRRNEVEPLVSSDIVTIQHDIMSTIPSVGLQNLELEQGLILLLLPGLVGILLARVAKTVFLTDKGDQVLDNCAKNIGLNSRGFKAGVAVHVKELDWTEPWPPEQIQGECPPNNRYSWTSAEVEEAQGASLLAAADVIYNDDLTDAFFNILERFMSQGSEKVLYLALEKRYNFTLDDFDIVANGYSRFLSYMKHERENCSLEHASEARFLGNRIDLDNIPQYVENYERGKDVEIWQIKYHRKEFSDGEKDDKHQL